VVVFVLVVAVAAVSLAAPLVRAAAPAPALTVASLRIVVAAILFIIIARSSLGVLRRLSRADLLRITLAGLLMGAHFGVWITSLYLTSTAASVALVATQPVFAALLGRIFLGDRVGRRELVGIAIAGLGCVVLAGGDWASNPAALLGDLLAVIGAAAAAAYLVVGRSMGQRLPLLPYLAMVNLVAGVALLVAAVAAGARFTGYSDGVYLAIVANAIVCSAIGHTLLNWSVRRTPAHLVTLFILGEPVGASLLMWGFFAEAPPLHAVIGGVVILAGIAVGFARFDSLGPRD
jgi:drug/metabolite transporter (DMT)-like permease